MANLIRFWVGAGEQKISLTPFDASELQGHALFTDFPVQDMSLPVRKQETDDDGNPIETVTRQKMSLRKWVMDLLKQETDDDSNPIKTHQSWVEFDESLMETRISGKSGRPYRSLDFTKKDKAEALVSFIQQTWGNLSEKVARGEEVVSEAEEALSEVTFK